MSVNIYPVMQSEEKCEDYKVKINGQEVKTDTARVSACPFNRCWPGYQRQLSQTELVNFVSLAADEPLEMEILPKKPFEQEKVNIRPLGAVREYVITPEGRITFQVEEPGFYTVEPFGRKHAFHLFVDPVKTYGVDQKDENVIYFGKGIHEAGLIELKSNQTLYLEEGALVYGGVKAYEAENIKILGRGILDNSHSKETILFGVHAEDNEKTVDNAVRLHAVDLEYCDGIEIDGITIRDSLAFTICPTACKNIQISDVKIIGNWRYNSDGIDMHNCENAIISNCFIRTFDDSICMKGLTASQEKDGMMYRNGKSYDIFQNILVENCTIWNDWGKCLEIGAEARAKEIRNITFRDCKVIHALGRVLDCMNVDYADIHDITFENISVEYDEVMDTPLIQKNDAEVYQNPDLDFTPELISLEVIFHYEYSYGGKRRGKIRNFVFQNIRLTGRQYPKILICGYDETHRCSNIRISDLYWNGERITALPREHFKMGEHCDHIVLE